MNYLKEIKNGTKCKHTGLHGKDKDRSSMIKDKGLVFVKTCDAFQTLENGDEVIFHPNDWVEVM